MNLRKLLVASAIGLCIAAPLRAADPQLIADAKAFGAREAVIRPDLSADGSHVIYVTPGPARTSVAVIGNLDTRQFIPVMAIRMSCAGATSRPPAGRYAGLAATRPTASTR